MKINDTDGGAANLPCIEFRDVTVQVGSTEILRNFSLTVKKGEVAALLGPSGAGKTTALRVVAGLTIPTGGKVLLDGQDVTGTPTFKRGIGLVVQQYALFPHMTVAENVAYGMRARRQSKSLIAPRVEEVLSLVGMGKFSKRFPRELSGGQQQRVAIARALAPHPKVLLLDEPLSALDPELRQELLSELCILHREIPELTMLYVTHGQSEALTLADRIAVMAEATLVEVGNANQLYSSPKKEFTAKFLGSANVVQCKVIRKGFLATSFDRCEMQMETGTAEPGSMALVGIRPHHLRILFPEQSSENEFDFQVEDIQWRGATHILSGQGLGTKILVEATELRALPKIGQQLRIGFDTSCAFILDSDETSFQQRSLKDIGVSHE